jgi:catalase-peroxidase
MTVLLGGMRVLNTNFDHSNNGVFTQRPEVLTNDFFLNLLDMTTTWKSVSESDTIFEGHNRTTGELKALVLAPI